MHHAGPASLYGGSTTKESGIERGLNRGVRISASLQFNRGVVSANGLSNSSWSREGGFLLSDEHCRTPQDKRLETSLRPSLLARETAFFTRVLIESFVDLETVCGWLACSFEQDSTIIATDVEPRTLEACNRQ